MTDLIRDRIQLDFIGDRIAPIVDAIGKKTRLYSATLAKTGIFPYWENGEVYWALKAPEDFLCQDAVNQFENLIVTHNHPGDMRASHNHAVGYCRDVSAQENKYLRGNIAVFAPIAHIAIDAGDHQLSMGALCDLKVIDREIDGVFVKYQQVNPRFDHEAIVPRGRAGSDVALHTLRDSFDGPLSMAIEVPIEFVKPKIILNTGINDMDELVKLQAKYDTLLTQSGVQAASLSEKDKTISDSMDKI